MIKWDFLDSEIVPVYRYVWVQNAVFFFVFGDRGIR